MALKARCRTDRLLFARFFFHEKLGHSFSRFHRETFDEPKTPFAQRAPMSGFRRARMVPRGNGKTTTRVRIAVLHDAVYEYERFIVIIAEQQDLSRKRLREIRLELERNERMRRFFGDLKGNVWHSDDLELSNGVMISAKSMRGQVRGITNPLTNERPTMVYCDDAEHSREVLNPENRAKQEQTFHEDIEGGGTTDGRTCYQFTGTPLHRLALLMKLKNNPAWDFRSYPAIESWPERMDLWDRCRQIWCSAGASDAEEGYSVPESATEVAWRFYQANRAEMDRGSRVLWPEGEPLFALMVWRWANGEAAFYKEKLLEPRDPTIATFDLERAVRHELRGDAIFVRLPGSKEPRKVKLEHCQIVCFHDPCGADPKAGKGTKKLGDYAAIVTMAIERTERGGSFGHVIDAWMSQRAPVSAQIQAAFEIAERWNPSRMIVEGDTYKVIQRDYRDERDRRKRIGLFWQVPLYAVDQQTANKDARIATMEPAVTNGWITFSTALPQPYWDQLGDHPTGDHDDGPDATEGCWRFGRRPKVGLRML